jgi:hypothetical protein
MELACARGTERQCAELTGAGPSVRERWGSEQAQERRRKGRKRRGERKVRKEDNLMLTNFSHPPNRV